MSGITSLTRQPIPLKVDGIEETYYIHPLTIDDFGALQAWVDAQFPDPFQVVDEAIKRGNYSLPQQQYLMKLAMDAATGQSKHPIGTPEADALLGGLEGFKQLLTISIRKGKPDFSNEEARNLYMHLSLGELQAVLTATEVGALMADPKPSSSTPNGNGNSISPRRRTKVKTGGLSSTN